MVRTLLGLTRVTAGERGGRSGILRPYRHRPMAILVGIAMLAAFGGLTPSANAAINLPNLRITKAVAAGPAYVFRGHDLKVTWHFDITNAGKAASPPTLHVTEELVTGPDDKPMAVLGHPLVGEAIDPETTLSGQFDDTESGTGEQRDERGVALHVRSYAAGSQRVQCGLTHRPAGAPGTCQ